jgi:hypothetical protein
MRSRCHEGPGGWACFVAGLDRLGLVVHSLHGITVSSPVPGRRVLVMILRVIPTERGEATAAVKAAVGEKVGVLNESVCGSVGCGLTVTDLRALVRAPCPVVNLSSYVLLDAIDRQTDFLRGSRCRGGRLCLA